MTVIEHWIAHWDHGKIAVPAHVVTSAENADEHRANGWRVEGPFVPADTRGAVEAEVERVLKDDEAMRRAVRAHERSAVGGRTAMTRAIRAAFEGSSRG